MPTSIPMAIRQSIVSRYKKGESVTSLSHHFQVSRGSIYTLLKRHDSQGADGLRTRYDRCGKSRPDEKSFLFRAVRCMRCWHPQWGAEKIRAEMLLMRPHLILPHYRTFTRWFHWNEQLQTAMKSVLPRTKFRKAKRLHEGWQIDAKEELIVADSSKNCWLNITDEYSGAVISPPVFSPKQNQRGFFASNATDSDSNF